MQTTGGESRPFVLYRAANAARRENIDLHPSTADETGQSNMSKIFDFVKD
ncbi:class II fructose-bisphosphate aldolase, partial [Vibrio vulnificus]